MTLYDKTIEYVNNFFPEERISHFERTVYWMERLYPVCAEAHRIAAYSHDIERGVKGERDRKYLDSNKLKRHQEIGAEIMGEFLRNEGASAEVIEKVKHLIGKHEVGGGEEQNALKDADSISFFETNAEMFVRERTPEDGYEAVKEKLDWMFNRITSPVAKEAARVNYERWSGELGKHKLETK